MGNSWVVNKNGVVVPGKALTITATANNNTTISNNAGIKYVILTPGGLTLYPAARGTPSSCHSP